MEKWWVLHLLAQRRASSSFDEITSSHYRFIWAATTLQATADSYLVCVPYFLDMKSRQIGIHFTCIGVIFISLRLRKLTRLMSKRVFRWV